MSCSILMRRLGPVVVSVDRPTGVYLSDFLHWYSVVYTAESVSLFYLLFISQFVCTRGLYINKLGIFHTIETSICLHPHQK